MFVFGIVGILQATVLPGLIFSRLFKPQGGPAFRVAATFLISMLVNFLLVYVLNWVHLYVRPVMLAIVIVELFTIIILYRSSLKTNFDDVGRKISRYISSLGQSTQDIFNGTSSSPAAKTLRGLIITVLAILAVSLVWWFFKRAVNSIGTVFNAWDAVFSWNSWAQIWAQGQFPEVEGLYPQLLPINLSLPYLFTSNLQVSFFSKFIVALFPLLTILVVFEQAFSEKKYGYFVATILVYLLYKKFLGDIVTEAYADIPVAFAGLMTVIPYLRNNRVLANRQDTLLIFTFAATAAVIKQPGILLLGILAILAIIDGVRDKPTVKWLAICIGVAIAITLVGYIQKLGLALTDYGATGSPAYAEITANAYDSTNLLDRLFYAFKSLEKYMVLFAFLIPATLLLNRKFKLLILAFVIPFTFTWAILASYDTRNLALVYPLVAISCGLSLQSIIDFCLSCLEKLRLGHWPSWLLPLVFIASVGTGGILFTRQKITGAWVEKQKLIFSPVLNEQLYSLNFDNDCRFVLTNYPVRFLPGLESNMMNFYFDGIEAFHSYLEDPSICWILIPPYAEQAIQNEVDSKIQDGTYELIFGLEDWVNYRLIKIR